MRTSQTPGPVINRRLRLPCAAGYLSTVVALLAASLFAALPAAHAAEGSLCSGAGVNIVVDFQELGGGIEQACDESGAGKFASQVFADAGFELTPVGAFPGAACQVNGKPEGVRCAQMPPADAYWGLYLAKNDTWGYAPTGADELKLADGAFVAFSWQGSKTPALPGVAPVEPAVEKTDPAAEPASDEAQDEASSLPLWVPAIAVGVLAVAAAAIGLRRRRLDRTP